MALADCSGSAVHWIAGIAGLNPAEVMEVCVLCWLWVL
jgi:hypothetical protein